MIYHSCDLLRIFHPLQTAVWAILPKDTLCLEGFCHLFLKYICPGEKGKSRIRFWRSISFNFFSNSLLKNFFPSLCRHPFGNRACPALMQGSQHFIRVPRFRGSDGKLGVFLILLIGGRYMEFWGKSITSKNPGKILNPFTFHFCFCGANPG